MSSLKASIGRQHLPVSSLIEAMAIATINPATGKLLASFEPLSDAEVEDKLQLAMRAFREHRYSSLTERAAVLMCVANVLEVETQGFSRLITTEMGKAS